MNLELIYQQVKSKKPSGWHQVNAPEGFKYLGCGNWRQGMAYGDLVLKMPTSTEGELENIFEYAFYKQEWNFLEKHSRYYRSSYCQLFLAYLRLKGEPLPFNPCELIEVDGSWSIITPLLRWPGSDSAHYYDRPKWSCLSDGFQAGLDHNGEWMLYDYNAWANHSKSLHERHWQYDEMDLPFEKVYEAIPQHLRDIWPYGK